VSPRRRVAILTGLLAALGVGVSAAIIAAGGGFSGQGPSILHPPTDKDIWQVGANIKNGTTLEYELTSKAESSSLDSAKVSMSFKDAGDDWSVRLIVTNGTGQAIEKTIRLSKALTKEGQLDESTKPYFEPVQSSVLAVRDMDYSGRPKYLVPGAPWDTIFVGSSSITVRVTGEETVQTQAGSFDSFVLGYKLLDKTSKIWVVRDMPFPVKAEVYDAEDNLQYRYELVKMSGISSAYRS
jgi:hypothetical protein